MAKNRKNSGYNSKASDKVTGKASSKKTKATVSKKDSKPVKVTLPKPNISQIEEKVQKTIVSKIDELARFENSKPENIVLTQVKNPETGPKLEEAKLEVNEVKLTPSQIEVIEKHVDAVFNPTNEIVEEAKKIEAEEVVDKINTPVVDIANTLPADKILYRRADDVELVFDSHNWFDKLVKWWNSLCEYLNPKREYKFSEVFVNDTFRYKGLWYEKVSEHTVDNICSNSKRLDNGFGYFFKEDDIVEL